MSKTESPNTVQNLLWALHILGVSYHGDSKKFHIIGTDQWVGDPVQGAKWRHDYLRAKEVQADQTLPQTFYSLLHELREMMKNDLRASNVRDWRKKVERRLDEYEFNLRKIRSPDET